MSKTLTEPEKAAFNKKLYQTAKIIGERKDFNNDLINSKIQLFNTKFYCQFYKCQERTNTARLVDFSALDLAVTNGELEGIRLFLPFCECHLHESHAAMVANEGKKGFIPL